MGLFRKHDASVVKRFDEIFAAGANQSENEFLDSLNEIVKIIEVDNSYSTNEKLKIYELLSLMNNSSSTDRPKIAKKIRKALK
jgi:hypothetical protein